MHDPELWSKVSDYVFPDNFRERLMSELDWANTRADAVVAMTEYRRFVYLALISKGSVTPSKRVDAVWHLHLTDTKDYWDRFCPDVLGGPLHHLPAKGGAEDASRHAAQYRETLDLYEREFARAAPASYWPAGSQIAGRRRSFATIGGTLLILLGGGLGLGFAGTNLGIVGIVLGVGGVLLMVGAALRPSSSRSRKRRDNNGSTTFFWGCSSDHGGGSDGGGGGCGSGS